MKNLTPLFSALAISIASSTAFATEVSIQVEPAVSRLLNSFSISSIHVATDPSRACRSRYIDHEAPKVYAEKTSLNPDGDRVSVSAIKAKCESALERITFEGRLNRRAVEAESDFRSASEMMRLEIPAAPSSGKREIRIGCSVLPLYVPESSQKRATLVCAPEERAGFDPNLKSVQLVFYRK